jgi:hypothetical protein
MNTSYDIPVTYPQGQHGRICPECAEVKQFGTDDWKAVHELEMCLRCHNKTQKELKRKKKNDA